MQDQDIYLDQDFDLSMRDGDFLVESDLEQRTACIANAERGHYKQWPLLGAAVGSALNAPQNFISQTLKLQLEADGLKVNSISFTDQNLVVDADYKPTP